jgi:hypothetical protein
MNCNHSFQVAAVAATLDLFETDCAITVALKITDDSCKMDDEQRALFMTLYDHLPDRQTTIFDETVFHLIEIGRNNPSAFIFSEIRELREMAMEKITRPKMKAFKASIRKKITAQKIIN